MSLLKKGESTGREELGRSRKGFRAKRDNRLLRAWWVALLFEPPSGDFTAIIFTQILVLRTRICVWKIIAGVIVPSRLHFPSENEISRHDFGKLLMKSISFELEMQKHFILYSEIDEKKLDISCLLYICNRHQISYFFLSIIIDKH